MLSGSFHHHWTVIVSEFSVSSFLVILVQLILAEIIYGEISQFYGQ